MSFSPAASCYHTSAPAFVEKKSTKMWGGRFSRDVDTSILGWTESITADSNLVAEDIWGSLSHVTMLGHQKIVAPEKVAKILPTLLGFQNSWLDGSWEWMPSQEDVHMNVEAKLIEALGMETGGWMHTCRSRNDQVVLDSKLYTRRRLVELRGRVIEAARAFIRKAEPHTEDVMISYTHVQHAQPVSVAYWLSHYAAHLVRDLDRLKRAYDVTDENPLGSGAIAGTSFPIDRTITSDFLGFQKIHDHGMDATSSRDFMMEALNANAILQVTLGRIAEEFILWSSHEFRSLTLDDGFAMGSSMMPQKKNPGALELMRGRTGRISGYASAGFTLMKGLPSGYNRDFHEEKELLIASMDLINRAVEVIPPLVNTTTINLERMHELTYGNFGNATELANYLVSKHNTPFRRAHDIVGSLVGELYRAGQNFSNKDFCMEHLVKEGVNAPREEVEAMLDPKAVMLSYTSRGGTGKEPVEDMMREITEQLDAHKAALDADSNRLSTGYNAARALAAEANSIKSHDDIVKLVKKHRPSSLSQ